MIDQLVLSPIVHVVVGGVLFVVATAALVMVLWEARQRRPLSRVSVATLIFLQLLLFVQIMLGIKLLDQGHGIRQLYVHYVGGVAPLAFYFLLYWLPVRDHVKRTYLTAAVTVASFVFILLTFAVGSMYVNG